ncbi:MAG: hypothetical protein WBP69_04885, partial [Terriglobales bacterium]
MPKGIDVMACKSTRYQSFATLQVNDGPSEQRRSSRAVAEALLASVMRIPRMFLRWFAVPKC